MGKGRNLVTPKSAVLLAATTEMKCLRQILPMRGAGKKARKNTASAKVPKAMQAASSCASTQLPRCTSLERNHVVEWPAI